MFLIRHLHLPDFQAARLAASEMYQLLLAPPLTMQAAVVGDVIQQVLRVAMAVPGVAVEEVHGLAGLIHQAALMAAAQAYLAEVLEMEGLIPVAVAAAVVGLPASLTVQVVLVVLELLLLRILILLQI